MMSSCTTQRWTLVAALFVLFSLILLPGRLAAATADALLEPTPLVLKDGRIANVSIHVVPFAAGQTELARDAAAGLTELTASVATDCFLTAQIIGHVSSDEVADNDTLGAHRLARSRSDKVQASLIDGGLPAKAIASVWDWQFLVREPRATLWVFRLIQGEDCDGEPLEGAGAQLVAGNEGSGGVGGGNASRTEASAQTRTAAVPKSPAPSEPAAKAAEADTKATPAEQSLPMVSSAMAAEARPARTPERSRQATPRPETAPAGPAKDGVPVVTKRLPAASPAQDTDQPASLASSPRSTQGTAPSGERTMAAVQQARTAPAESARAGATEGARQSAKRPDEQDPERQGRVEQGTDGDVIITFATNSSYFPPGTSRRLRSLTDKMAGGGPYRVQLQIGVSGSDTVVGASSPEEARRYNKWLAERRGNRVQEWLSENVQSKQFEVEPAFVADDDSRQVVVRVVPKG